MAVSDGGATAIALAATRPERVSSLMLYGTYARLLAGPDYPIGRPPDRVPALLGLVRTEWGLGSRVLADVFIPEADASRVAWFTRYQQLAAPPETAAAYLATATAQSPRA
jgi:pimeloyl-ACP methyl ester carboxylesterase